MAKVATNTYQKTEEEKEVNTASDYSTSFDTEKYEREQRMMDSENFERTNPDYRQWDNY